MFELEISKLKLQLAQMNYDYIKLTEKYNNLSSIKQGKQKEEETKEEDSTKEI